jgi:hypothetical protein
MTNTKRLRAKKILDMLTQVILDEDKYDDNSVEVIALSNSLDKVKVNKGHLFPSDGNSIVEYNITQENTSKQVPGLTASEKEKLFIELVSTETKEGVYPSALIYVLKCIMQDPDKHAMVSKYIETIDLNEVTYNNGNLANAQKSFEDFVFNIFHSDSDYREKEVIFVELVSDKFPEGVKLAIKHIMEEPANRYRVTKYLETIDIDEVTANPEQLDEVRKSFEEFIVHFAETSGVADEVLKQLRWNRFNEATEGFSDEEKKKLTEILKVKGNPIASYVKEIPQPFITGEEGLGVISKKIREMLDAKTTKTYGLLEIKDFAKTLDKEDDSLWDKRNGVPLLSNFKKFGIDHKTLMKELRGFRRDSAFRTANAFRRAK